MLDQYSYVSKTPFKSFFKKYLFGFTSKEDIELRELSQRICTCTMLLW